MNPFFKTISKQLTGEIAFFLLFFLNLFGNLVGTVETLTPRLGILMMWRVISSAYNLITVVQTVRRKLHTTLNNICTVLTLTRIELRKPKSLIIQSHLELGEVSSRISYPHERFLCLSIFLHNTCDNHASYKEHLY